VGIANLFFLPFAGKMRLRMREEHQRRDVCISTVFNNLDKSTPLKNNPKQPWSTLPMV
jgi:flagellar motor component MotA